MKLEGLHHVTAITGDAQRNLDFYVGRLGLRFVKKTVNFDQPDAYHLYYADADASPGAVVTFFEYAGILPGRAGAGMVHRILYRVGSESALDFWAARLGAARDSERVVFADPEGLEGEIVLVDGPDQPLAGRAPDIPPEHALQGLQGVRAFARDPAGSAPLLGDVLELVGGGTDWEAAGARRHATLRYDPPPASPGHLGAGTVHHIAWHSPDEDHAGWRDRVAKAGYRPMPIIDRQYFRSIYFRESSGVLFEIATTSPGFVVDEPADHLGEELKLPPQHEPLRGRLEKRLTPLAVPRSGRPA